MACMLNLVRVRSVLSGKQAAPSGVIGVTHHVACRVPPDTTTTTMTALPVQNQESEIEASVTHTKWVRKRPALRSRSRRRKPREQVSGKRDAHKVGEKASRTAYEVSSAKTTRASLRQARGWVACLGRACSYAFTPN